MKDLIGIVAHDAGGAEVLSNWAKHCYQHKVIGYGEGPAVEIFKKLGIKQVKDINLLLEVSKEIITATSWQSNLEKKTIRKCLEEEKYVSTMLDHWVNYQERFKMDGKLLIPNKILTLDKHATEIARTFFDRTHIVEVENVYLNNKIKKVISYQKKTAEQTYVLFIGENIKEHALKSYGNENYFGYNEETILKSFWKRANKQLKKTKNILIRPHPSQDAEQYEWVKEVIPINVTISNKRELEQDIAESDIVYGINSMALVIAALSGKDTFSCLPIESKLDLPYGEILRV